MKKRWIGLVLAAAMSISLAACGGSSEDASAGASAEAGAENAEVSEDAVQIVYIIAGSKMGDQAENDNVFAGISKYAEETGASCEYFELAEMQDFDSVARSYCDNGFDLVVGNPSTSEFINPVAADYPEVRFVCVEGTTPAETDNVMNVKTSIQEAAFVTGAFAALMNEELGGSKTIGFVGGVRNPNLERAQYGYTAGAQYVGGDCTTVYVGNFTDAAKSKELATQLFSGDTRIVQAWAGSANTGVFEAAESMGDGYYAMGGAGGQFDMSDSIIASQVKDISAVIYNACNMAFGDGWKAGENELGLEEEAVDLKYAPDGRDEIVPQEIKDQIDEIRQKIISGEIVPPSTEEEMAEFQAESK